MEKPKWLKFIVVSGIIISIIDFLANFKLALDLEKGAGIGYSVLFSGIMTSFVIFAFFKLYKLKNWARDIVILLSAIELIFFFYWLFPKWYTIYSLCQKPLYLFYFIYLMKSDTRSYFTEKKRSALKIFGGCAAVLTLVTFLGLTSFVGSLFNIDYDQKTVKLTPRGKELMGEVINYEKNKKRAEQLLAISFPKDYKIYKIHEYPDLNIITFFKSKGDSFLGIGNQHITFFDLKNKRNVGFDEAIDFVFGNEKLKGWEDNIKFEDQATLKIDYKNIPTINIKYNKIDGLLGFYKTSKQAIVFMTYPYTLDLDTNNKIDKNLLRDALKLFEESDINAKDKNDLTILMRAITRGDIDAVKLLIDKGANINAKDRFGTTSLMMAASKGHTEIIQLLLDNGSDVNAKNQRGLTALMWAAGTKDQPETIELLLNNGANIDAQDKNGITALMGAAAKGYNNTVKLLINRGADVNAKSKNGETALMYAKAGEHTEIISFIKTNRG